MNPKIRDVVIKAGGTKAKVSGPIRWDTDETSATFRAAIVQMNPADGTTVVAVSRQVSKPFTRLDPLTGGTGDLTWKATVETLAGGTLTSGRSADGWAVAAVVETAGIHSYPWQVPNLNVT
jgi:hypothetical protein